MNWGVRSIKKFVEFWIIMKTCFFLVSTVTGCVSISDFSSLVGIPVGIASSALGLKVCVITAGI